ncbi:hypothetical protein MKK68_13100 [Methylobacterium sp. E-016]|uniref:hypothetical protein n=1 Tax=Methylobacterium sp. E-016 TaxID=2836556 RepID=UPI001FBBD71F|nr:hypothetical protein [Methylobacterium sp. E-016]MCJ2076582.1 hypothetical protein [Methylobacterium sp. E-016]
MKPELSSPADVFAPLRDAASAIARNFGLAADVQQISPEHWQRVLAAVEDRMRMRGIEMPEDWRDELADQMGRLDGAATTGPES